MTNVWEKIIITYDFGTGSVKAALIDKNQNVLAWDSVHIKCIIRTEFCYSK